MIETKQRMRVREIVLNAPENGNALNIAVCTELGEALDRAEDDRSVDAVVLRANGADFCSGMDLKEQLEADKVQLGGIHQRLFSAAQYIHKPIVAAVHGLVLAGGMGLAANAHIVVSHPDARFGLPEVKIGYWPVFIFRAVEHAIGERRAIELSLTGREFGAEEAQRYGLVTEISPDPVRRAFEIATQISQYSRDTIHLGLGYVHEIRGRDWERSGKIGNQYRGRIIATQDYSEGVRAAMENRQPRWPSVTA